MRCLRKAWQNSNWLSLNFARTHWGEVEQPGISQDLIAWIRWWSWDDGRPLELRAFTWTKDWPLWLRCTSNSLKSDFHRLTKLSNVLIPPITKPLSRLKAGRGDLVEESNQGKMSLKRPIKEGGDIKEPCSPRVLGSGQPLGGYPIFCKRSLRPLCTV